MNINDAFRDLNIGLPEDILRRKLHGDFEGAIRLIDARLAREDQPQGLRNCLIAQREMIRRTPSDYPLSRDEAIALVRELHPFEEVIETSAGCTICSHCGPNCLGVLFFKKA